MTISQFVNKWNGKKLDWDGKWGGQCVDLARFYWNEVLGISQPRGVVGAGDFWTNYDSDPNLKNNFTKIANTADFVPLEGDTMIWNKNAGGGYGHIAICVGKDHTKDYFHSFDQNWSKVSYCEVVKHNYKNVYGVLRPKKESDMADDMMEVSKKKFAELVGKSDKYDKFVKAGYDSADKIIKENADLKKQISDYGKKINDQYEIMLGLREDLKTCEGQLQETPSLEEYTKGYTPTGRKTFEIHGPYQIETSYKKD